MSDNPFSQFASDDNLDAHYEGAGKQYGVDPDLLRSVVQQESGGNPRAISGAGAEGIAQFLPATAREMGITDTYSPRQSIYGAAKYLSQNASRFGGDPSLAVAAYHGGPDVRQWGNKTAAYVDSVSSIYAARKARNPQVAAAGDQFAPQTQEAGTIAIGDSLASGVGAAGGFPTYAKVGAPPEKVLENIGLMPRSMIDGQNVILSGGASNGTQNVKLVAQQVAALYRKGAANVSIVGVGDRKDYAGVNDTLSTIAQNTGATFLPLDPTQLIGDRTHLKDYRSLLPGQQQSQATNPFAQFVQPKQATPAEANPFAQFVKPAVAPQEGKPLTSKQAVAQLPMAKTDDVPVVAPPKPTPVAAVAAPVGGESPGVAPPPLSPEAEAKMTPGPKAPVAEAPVPEGILGAVGSAGSRIAEAAKEGWNAEPAITDYGVKLADKYGLGGDARAVNGIMAAMNAGFKGFQQTMMEMGDAISPGLGRDLAGFLEAFPAGGAELGLHGASIPRETPRPAPAEVATAELGKIAHGEPSTAALPTLQAMADEARGRAPTQLTEAQIAPEAHVAPVIPPEAPAAAPVEAPFVEAPVARSVEPEPPPPIASPQRKPVDAVTALIDHGGVTDMDGDLAAIGADTYHHRAAGRLVTKNGMDLDTAREFLRDNGYLPQDADIQSVKDVIADHLSGRPTFAAEDAAQAVQWEQDRRIGVERERHGQYVAEVQHVADEAGVPLRPEEADHAATLTMQGEYPEEAIRQAAYEADLRDAGIQFSKGPKPFPEIEPHPDAIRAMVDVVQDRIGPHGRIELHDTGPEGFTVSTREGPVQARGFTIGRLMSVALGGDVENTLNHEAVHVLRNMGVFTPAEWRTLETAADRQGWAKQYGLGIDYPDLPPNELREEAIATQFGRLMSGKEPAANGFMRRILAKLRDWFGALRNKLNGNGFQTANDVFGQMERGEVGAREPGSGMPERGTGNLAVNYQQAARMLPKPREGGAPLFGEAPPAPRVRPSEEPTIKNDERQIMMPGMEPTARQAQGAREAAGPRGGQKAADEGLFAPNVVNQPILHDVARRPIDSAYHYSDGNLGMTSSGSFTRDRSRWLTFTPEEVQRISANGRPWGASREGMFVGTESGQRFAGASKAVEQKPLFAKTPADMPPAERKAWPITRMARGIMERAHEIGQSIAKGIAPIQDGTNRAMGKAADFANALRQSDYRYGQIDKEIERTYKPNEREAMGRAMDAQSVFEQEVRGFPEDKVAEARKFFDDSGKGLAGLPADQRRVVENLDILSQDVWRQMQQRGMVDPNARPLPYYFSRQIIQWTEAEGYKKAVGQTGAGRGIDERGRNLTTAGPMRRQHLTPEETEAAARTALGNQNAFLLRDIRSLPSRLAYAQKAIAGTDLIQAIDKVGKETGVNLVLNGEIPGILSPGDYFTMSDHPSFRQWTGSGFQAVHISKEFEGPLMAVLTKPSPAWYRAAQQTKGGVMSAIMFSPFMHLAVEIGRAFPIMPGRVATLQVFRDGSRVAKDLNYMDMATRDGIAPLGRSWQFDPATIADQAVVEGRSGFLNAVKQWRDSVATGAGKVAGQWAHDVLQHPHQTLLWDNVFHLQMGIYDNLRSKWIDAGFAPDVAGTMAAHIANRYAGALPSEHLAQSVNMASNLLLFSRSFTLGNLGVIKDMFNGAPNHIRARIAEMAGADVASSAQSALRRKAISAFALDIGMFYMANGLLQAGLATLSRATDIGLPNAAQSVYDDWLDGAKKAFANEGLSDPLSIFGVLPQHWNEPGKQDRVYAGTDSQGRGIYLRLPAGKVGEEFLGWFTKPGTMIMNKASPLVRPIIEEAIGYDTLGRPMFSPNPTTVGEYLQNAGMAVKHIAEGLGPAATIQGAEELFNEHVLGQKSASDPFVNAAKVIGPLTGVAQISQGFPGGPAAGEIHAESEKEKFEQQKQLGDIRKKIQAGKIDEATDDLRKLGVSPGLARYYVRQTTHPGATPGQTGRFMHNAPPGAIDRLRRHGLELPNQ